MLKNSIIEVLLAASALSVLALVGGLGVDLRAQLEHAPFVTASVLEASGDVWDDATWQEEDGEEIGCWYEDQFLYAGEEVCVTDEEAVRCDIDSDGVPVLAAGFCGELFE